jgi:serine/threonine protein kinase
MPPDEPTVPPAPADTVPPAAGTRTLPPTAALPAGAVLLHPGKPPLPFTLGRYRLEQQLGQGGMGAVYRAHDSQLGRTVALKVPFLSGPTADAVRARFLREAQSAAVLAHPNICPVHDLGEIDGVPYITMAFVQGSPLARLIDPANPVEPARAATIVRKVALALAEAHSKGVIHRDLKPGNVMLDERGEPIVMDFGLARRSDAELPLTQEGELMGTPAYMPPEQVAGNVAAMGPACDVYSLGVMLFELVAGRPPFLGDLFSLVGQITADPAPPPSRFRPGLDPRFDAVCLRALAKQPGDRFPSMRAFADAVAALENAPVPLVGPRLTLRISGTPFAYRPAPTQTVISLGRQKRRPGEPPEAGNDVVLRVPNNDMLSARISRRHLEIHRQDEAYTVIDRSKAGTLLNGRPLTRDVATPLAAGDRLVVAGVLGLEVEMEGSAGRSLNAPEVSVPVSADNRAGCGDESTGTARVVLEVSVGDMVTME